MGRHPETSKKRRFKPEVLEEAKRIHGNVVGLREQDKAELPMRFAASLEAKFWPGLRYSTGGYCQNCLLEGQGWFALHGDIGRARAAFAEVNLVLPYYKRMQELSLGAATNPDAPKEEDRFVGTSRDFEALLFCALFADDRETAQAAAELVADEKTFPGYDHFDVFTRHLAALIRGDRARVKWADYDEAMGMKHLKINPYRRAPVDFAAGDMQAINRTVPDFEAGYATRGRMRDSTHLAYGAASLGQAMSFDVYGTALLKLAAWLGVPNDVDTRAHPAAFTR
jgi:hypothetical protein